MLAGAGDLAGPAISLMHAVFKAADVDAKTRELIIVRTAKAVGCEYALRAGAVIAANTGLTAEEVGAAKGTPTPAPLRPRICCCAKVVDELSIGGNLSDATLRALLARYDGETCRKLVLMVCWFNLVNRFENGLPRPVRAIRQARDHDVSSGLAAARCVTGCPAVLRLADTLQRVFSPPMLTEKVVSKRPLSKGWTRLQAEWRWRSRSTGQGGEVLFAFTGKCGQPSSSSSGTSR